MRKQFLAFFLLVSTLLAEHTAQYGYSFFNAGFQSTFYTQTYTSDSGDNYYSEAELTSPYYATGTLTRVNDTYDFSIVAGSTLFATATDEKYYFNNSINDQHKLNMSVSDIAILVHYKFDLHQRFLFGGSYTYETIKRYNFSDPELKKIGVIENNIGTIALKIGYLYDSKLRLKDSGWHYRGGVVVGLPFIAITTDSYPTPENPFEISNTFGLNIAPHGYLGYPIAEGIELGAYFNYLYQIRHEQVRASDNGGQDALTSKNTTQRLDYGLSLSWNFN